MKRYEILRTVTRKSGHKFSIFREHRGLFHKMPYVDVKQYERDAVIKARKSTEEALAALIVKDIAAPNLATDGT